MSTVNSTTRAVQPAIPVRAASPAAQAVPTFKTIDAYESYVRSSDVMKLPAARAAVADDQAKLGRAQAALDVRKKETNFDGLNAALQDAEAKLDEANHPMRAQANALQAQIPALSEQSGNLMAQVSQAQSQIGNIQANRAAAMNSNNGYQAQTVWGALAVAGLETAGYAADQATINSLQRQIGGWVGEKARIDADVMTKTMTAATLAAQPAAPEVIKPFQEAVSNASKAFAAATLAIKPEADAVSVARGTLGGDTMNENRLVGLENELKNYGDRFSTPTAASLWWKDHAWKKSLDTFWNQLGL